MLKSSVTGSFDCALYCPYGMDLVPSWKDFWIQLMWFSKLLFLLICIWITINIHIGVRGLPNFGSNIHTLDLGQLVVLTMNVYHLQGWLWRDFIHCTCYAQSTSPCLSRNWIFMRGIHTFFISAHYSITTYEQTAVCQSATFL